ncbi:MAG TPA: RNA 3'-terminal phosphate cyclase [Candidatus Lokiarchaeia archaeon]|nr:RNA 3'-terminal phosphate cyclase [Candidatus Lokiarchaeia archaeon]
MLEIDGSIGGGSILRVGAGFAVLTQTPIHVFNIRKNRDKPGLRTQHMVGLQAAADLSGGVLDGAEVGSTEITFQPGIVAKQQVDLSIATAGSMGLVLQALQIACLQAPDTTISVNIRGGGTYGTGAPSTAFLQNVTYPVFKLMGYSVDLRVNRHGFYPKGGASATVEFRPPVSLRPLVLEERGELVKIGGFAIAHSNLQKPRVCERIADQVSKSLGSIVHPGDIAISYVNTLSVGVGVDLWAEFDSGARLGTGTILGERGVPSETIAQNAVQQMQSILDSGATVDPYLSDQVLPLLAACPEPCAVVAPALTLHASTNIDILRLFAPGVRFITEQHGKLVTIRSELA